MDSCFDVFVVNIFEKCKFNSEFSKTYLPILVLQTSVAFPSHPITEASLLPGGKYMALELILAIAKFELNILICIIKAYFPFILIKNYVYKAIILNVF